MDEQNIFSFEIDWGAIAGFLGVISTLIASFVAWKISNNWYLQNQHQVIANEAKVLITDLEKCIPLIALFIPCEDLRFLNLKSIAEMTQVLEKIKVSFRILEQAMDDDLLRAIKADVDEVFNHLRCFMNLKDDDNNDHMPIVALRISLKSGQYDLYSSLRQKLVEDLSPHLINLAMYKFPKL